MRLDPQGPFKRDPPAPHKLTEHCTSTDDLIVLCHFGVPRLDRSQWSLRIDGLVERPVTLGFADLARYPRVEVSSVHQCSGSPFDPSVPTRRVGNVTWAGARLSDVLADCRPTEQARYLWCYGADGGVFGGVAVDGYMKDLPLSRVHADVLICYALNGEELSAEHGFPARLIVPGFYGTNSVKWLTAIVVADDRANGPFTTRWYQDPDVDEAGRSRGTRPVWSIAPESLIVSPAAGQSVRRDDDVDIWGWAWADGGVSDVEVRVGDEAWKSVQLQPQQGWQWQRFSTRWTPRATGAVEVAVRATSTRGQMQPAADWRNAIHRVSVNVD